MKRSSKVIKRLVKFTKLGPLGLLICFVLVNNSSATSFVSYGYSRPTKWLKDSTNYIFHDCNLFTFWRLREKSSFFSLLDICIGGNAYERITMEHLEASYILSPVIHSHFNLGIGLISDLYHERWKARWADWGYNIWNMGVGIILNSAFYGSYFTALANYIYIFDSRSHTFFHTFYTRGKYKKQKFEWGGIISLTKKRGFFVGIFYEIEIWKSEYDKKWPKWTEFKAIPYVQVGYKF